MKQQIEKILHFLDGEEIACEYMEEDRVIHALYNDGETEVRCFFLCGIPGKVVSYSICSEPIDMARREEIETNMQKINEEIHTGYFYFDMDNQRIAYYNDFQTNTHAQTQVRGNEKSNFANGIANPANSTKPNPQTETTESKNSLLEQFCRWSYETFRHYAKALYV